MAGQESLEREGSVIEVQGYKWLGKPHKIQNSQRGEGGVRFLIGECLIAEVEFSTNVNLEESAWIKVCGVQVGKFCTLDAFICLELLLVLP